MFMSMAKCAVGTLVAEMKLLTASGCTTSELFRRKSIRHKSISRAMKDSAEVRLFDVDVVDVVQPVKNYWV